MRLSIIITNHNYGRFLRDAVMSACRQSHRDTEVIVVDDGSVDDSLSVLATFGGSIQVIVQPNRGQAGAFNTGLRRATGEVIIFLDADDRLAYDVGERVVHRLRTQAAVVRVQFPLRLINGAGDRLGPMTPAAATDLSRGDLRPRLDRFPDDVPWQPTSGNAFRRTALDRIFPVPVDPYRICADYYLSNLVPWLGEVDALDEPGGDYRVHGSNNEYAAGLELDRLHANLVRTVETHRLARELAAQVYRTRLPIDPLETRSVSFLANRLLSLRLDPRGHPFRDDGRMGLLRRGVAAALGRFDLGWPARVTRALWFLALAGCPAGAISAVAVPYQRRCGLLPTPTHDVAAAAAAAR